MHISDIKHLNKAYVFVDDVLAATLSRDGAETTFQYLDDYLSAGRPPVATTLPLDDKPTITNSGAVPAFFAGLLPEGRRLTFLRQAAKTSADDEFTLVVACGQDPVGNVCVMPTPEPPDETHQTHTEEPAFSEMTFSESLSGIGVVDPASLAGVQDKVSGRMLTVPLAFGGRCHLLKLQVPEYPFVVENEAYFLAAAKRLRGDVVHAEVVHDAQGASALLVSRFDRVVDNGTLRRCAVEDASQLLGIHPASKYRVTTEDMVAAVVAACPAASVAALAALRQVLFAWVTGNGDLHAKNMSVVGSTIGFVVAPTYDIPSTYPYGDRSMALTVAGRTDSLSGKRFLALAQKVGLPDRAARKLVSEVLAATEHLGDEILAGALPFDSKRCKDLARVIGARRRALEPAAG